MKQLQSSKTLEKSNLNLNKYRKGRKKHNVVSIESRATSVHVRRHRKSKPVSHKLSSIPILNP